MSSTLTHPASVRAPSPAMAATACLLFATTAWGSLFFVGKSLLRTLDPVWFTTLRYLAATLLLVALRPAFGQARLARLRQDAAALALFGLAGYGAFSMLVFFGVTLSEPSHGAVVMATMPVTTVLLRWCLGGPRPTRKVVAAGVLALAGVALVAGLFTSGAAGGRRAWLGDLLALAGTLGWVAYTRGAARFPDLSPFDYTAFTAIASAPLLLAAALAATFAGALHWPDPAGLAHAALSLAYVAAIPTVAAAVAFNAGVKRLGPVTGTLFINCVPVSALAIATALGQPPAAHELAGAALVGLALVLATRPAPLSAAARTSPTGN